MKILITGANGMLAKSVKNKLFGNELICTDVEDLDITNLEDVRSFKNKINPNYIINCAAYTAVDKAEEQKDLAEKVNAIGPLNLAIVSKECNAKFIHISTDYVFNGNLDTNKVYLETDLTDPVTVYGFTKDLGEKNVINNCDNYYILRTAWLYGDGNNFVRTMLKFGKEKEEVSVVSDQHGSPTYAEDLADIIKQIIEKQIPYGLYHTTNTGFTTWYDFTKKIYELEKIDCKVNPVSSEEFVRPAKRPKNSKLSKDKILSQGIYIPSWEDGLKRYLEVERR
ncbi:MAG: dTDP-4-dehydrorhamnose reductase [Lachnospiraceae bacterium]|nr:dTDP-4-dehydrorhamnose reductase [Lachnospiraceae bacterium]